MARGGRRRLLAGLAVAASCLLLSGSARGAGMKNADPYWFADSYRTTTFVDLAATTAVVDTSGSGTVRLPALSPDGLAYAPRWVHADVMEVATASGVLGWGFNGTGLVREPFLDVAVTDPAGVTFLGRGPSGSTRQGVRIAVGSASGVGIYAWNGATWAQTVTIPATGTLGVAAGAGGGVLVAGAGGFALYSPAGQLVSSVSGLTGLAGVSSAEGGSVVAAWTGAGATFYGWTGSSYAPMTGWSEPVPSGGSLLGVAWFRGGGGFWLVTPTQAVAYAWNGTVLAPEPGRDTTAIPGTAAAVAPGWGAGSLAVLHQTGVAYFDPQAGGFGQDVARSVLGQSWGIFAPSAVLQSSLLPGLTHNIDEVKMVDSMASMPASTSLTYQVSTDGGQTWTSTPPLTPTKVPAGQQVQYRAVLSTTNATETPVLDATDMYEIATVTYTVADAVSWLVP